jgi:hypothetical protein
MSKKLPSRISARAALVFAAVAAGVALTVVGLNAAATGTSTAHWSTAADGSAAHADNVAARKTGGPTHGTPNSRKKKKPTGGTGANTPPKKASTVSQGITQPACNCTGPTAGLTRIANKTAVDTDSVSVVVTVREKLATPGTVTQISVGFYGGGASTRITQKYDTVVGNRINFDYPANDGKPFQVNVDISYSETTVDQAGNPVGNPVPFSYLVKPTLQAVWSVQVSKLAATLLDDCDDFDFSDENEIFIAWSDDRGLKNFSNEQWKQNETLSDSSFARTTSGTIDSGLQIPKITFYEDDGGAHAGPTSRPGDGPMLPGTSRTIDFVAKDPSDANCRLRFVYTLNLTVETFVEI